MTANNERLDYIALWEILSVVASFLIAEWVVLAFVGGSKLVLAIPVLLAFGLMVFSHRERGETIQVIGFRLDNFLAASRFLILPTAVAVVVILAAGWTLNQSLLSAPGGVVSFCYRSGRFFSSMSLTDLLTGERNLCLERAPRVLSWLP